MRILIVLLLPFLCGFTLPRGSAVEVVGEGFVQNGMQMDVYYYRHRDPPEKFSTVLRNSLLNRPGELVTKTLDAGVFSVGLLSENEYVSVTIQSSASGGTEGFLSKTKLAPQKIPASPIRLPDSFALTSHTFDPLGQETWVFSSKRDLVWVRNLLTQYNLNQVHRNLDGSALYGGVVGRYKLQISVSALDNGSSLVIVK